MKAPKNFYNTVDQRKLGLEDGLLPDVTAADNGKILKVSGGKWVTGDDENTIIEANPDEQPTVDLENLKIGDTVYSVKNPELTSIKSFKLTTSNGGQYCTSMPKIEFLDIAANIAPLVLNTDYTIETEHPLQYGSLALDAFPGVTDANTPNTYTITFVNAFNTEKYNLIKLTRGGSFPNDIAKNIKLELSADGENYLTIYDETTITWSDDVPYHLISLKDGSEDSTLLPIVTTADNGKVLGVSNGVWDKINVPSTATILELSRSGTTYTLPITFNELFDLITSGVDVIVSFNIYGNIPYSRVRGRITTLNTDANARSVEFAVTLIQDSTNKIIKVLSLNFTGNSASLLTVEITSAT